VSETRPAGSQLLEPIRLLYSSVASVHRSRRVSLSSFILASLSARDRWWMPGRSLACFLLKSAILEKSWRPEFSVVVGPPAFRRFKMTAVVRSWSTAMAFSSTTNLLKTAVTNSEMFSPGKLPRTMARISDLTVSR
jgi:hypothetical protein